MRRRLFVPAVLLSLAALAVPAQAQVEPDLLPVGSEAPDFSLPGVTQYGALRDPVRLSDFRGDVVVLAFFFKVRTRG